MGDLTEAFSGKMQGLYHLSKRQVGSLGELRYFFEELGSWSRERQESQRRLDSLLSSYSDSIKKGINSLIEEVGDLQMKNSIITKERNDLLVIVNKMSVEIEHPRDQLPIDKLVPEPIENSKQEVDCHDMDILNLLLPRAEENEGQSEEKDGIKITFENHDEKGFEDNVEQAMPQEKNDNVNPQLDHCINKFTDECVETIEHGVVKTNDHEAKETVIKNKRRKTYKSQQLISKHSMTKKLKNSHKNTVQRAGQGSSETKLDKSTNKPLIKRKDSVEREKKSKCKSEALQDIKGSLGDKLQNESFIRRNNTFLCHQCPYETSHKGHFLQHFQMHNDLTIKGGFGKKLMCDQCPYETSHKGHFIQHNRVHNETRNHLCEKCPFKAKTKDTLKDHIKAVHENIRDIVCEECGYATSRKGNLSEHMQTVHNTGEKKFKCNQCPYKAYLKKVLVKHVKNVHIGREHKFNCEKCNFKSNRTANLTTHILQVHK